MADGKGVALAILGIVAVIAVVGLVLLFTGATARVASPTSGDKIYGGNIVRGPYYETGYARYKTGRFREGEEFVYPERIKASGDQPVPTVYRDSSYKRTGPVAGASGPEKCPDPRYPDPTTSLYAFEGCVTSEVDPNFYCCPVRVR